MSCDPGVSLRLSGKAPSSLRRHLGGGHARNGGGAFYRAYLEARQLGLARGRAMDTMLGERLYRDFVRDSEDEELLRTKTWRYDAPGGRGNDGKSFATGGDRGGAEAGPTGGIYNLEFNTDGSILAAACEQKNVLLFDPASRKLVTSLEKAHEDGVNCVRFLDNRSFATCSDDTTVALWDARNLKERVRCLRGHVNWVKNIEFSRRENCLVTSGLDGYICLWDINRYSEAEDNCRKVFQTNGLMRMCLSGHGDRMVVSTMNGFIMVVHDLSLEDMQSDLKDFKPNMYRLLQMSGGQAISGAANFTPLFHAKRNRVEFLTDFAPENEAEFISSLKLHPQGWVAVSRNISADESTEWCCVHDIHAPPPSCDEDDEAIIPEIKKPSEESSSSSGSAGSSSRRSGRNTTGLSRLAEFLQDSQQFASSQPPPSVPLPAAATAGTSRSRSPSPQEAPRGAAAAPATISFTGSGTVRIRSNAVGEHGRQLVDNLIRRRRRIREEESAASAANAANPSASSPRAAAPDWEERGVVLLSPGSGMGNWVYFGTPREHRSQRQSPLPKDARVFRNRDRLTHYLEESNTGRGYIKEISFTPDGRIFCSPFGYGVRLLAFNEQCSDLSLCPPSAATDKTPKLLYEVGTVLKCHKDVVLTSAFSPNSFTLVTGCLGGDVVWHQPLP